MNYRAALVGLLLLIFALPLFAQDQDDEPLPPPKPTGSTKIGGAAGFLQDWMFFDFGPINELMRAQGLGEFDKSSMYAIGGQGYAYILVVPNLRVGGMGITGSSAVKTKSGNVVREVDLHVGYGGVTIDYVYNLLPRLDITGGILFGGGGLDFTINRSYGLTQDWNTTWGEFSGAAAVDEYSARLDGSFFIYRPSLNVEYSILRWVGLRVGVSYVGMSSPSWTRDEKFDLYGVPETITAQGWSINTGIFVGTFIF